MRRILLTLLALFFLGSSAYAATFDTLIYRPATDQGLYWTVEGTELLGKNNWSSGLWLDYAREPLAQLTAAGVKQPIVQDLVGGHLTGAFGIFPWLQVGLNPNLALLENFYDPTTRAQSTRFRLGDTRLSAKLRIPLPEQYPVTLAFVPYIDFPTGAGVSFLGVDSFAGGGTVAVETRRIEDRLTFAMNVGYYLREQVNVSGTPFDDLLTFGLAGNFLVIQRMELIAEFRGGTMASNLGNSPGTPIEGGGGFRFFFGKDRRIQATAGASMGIGSGLGTPAIRGLAGFAYTPPRRIRGVELQEQVREAFPVFELKQEPKTVDEMEELKKICPEKNDFNPETDDPRCLKLYLNQ